MLRITLGAGQSPAPLLWGEAPQSCRKAKMSQKGQTHPEVRLVLFGFIGIKASR